MMTSLECKVDIYVLKSLKNKCFSLLGEEIYVPEVILIFLIYCLRTFFYILKKEKSCWPHYYKHLPIYCHEKC